MANRRPATLLTEVFLCGAIAGTNGRNSMLNLSQAWGGLEQRIPMLQNASRFRRAISPRLQKQTHPPHFRLLFLPTMTSPFDLQSRDPG
jgi:hypothetical protein